ncbi:MAG: hypothetical protein IPG50_12395 [Myxococcales bacterium]|nr:hypothetical protein [Myxococcales bacterium]
MNPIAAVVFILRHADHFALGLAEQPLVVCSVIIGVVFVDAILPLALAPCTAMLFAIGAEASRSGMSPVRFGVCAFGALLAADYANRALGRALRRAVHPKPVPLGSPLVKWGEPRVVHVLVASALLPLRGLGALMAGAANVPKRSFFVASAAGAAAWVTISLAAGAAAAAGSGRAHHHGLIQGLLAAFIILVGPVLWPPRAAKS